MRRFTALSAAGTLALGIGVLAACAQEPSRGECAAVDTNFDYAEPSRADDQRFDLTGPGWIGGDSTYSVRLPDERTLWLFSDSFIGEVDDAGRPAPGMTMVHNVLLTEDAEGRLTTHTRRGPESFFPDPSGRSYYWVQDAQVEGDELLVFLSLTKQVGAHGFAWDSNAIARVSLPDLKVTTITPDPSGGDVAWGAGLMATPTHTWIYGIEDRQQEKYLHLARVSSGNLGERSRWEYLGAQGWSTQAKDSTRLTKGVANELSVSPFKDGYVMISSDTSQPFSATINAWTACSPTGPWRNPEAIYQTPESKPENHFTYNAHAHPELSPEGELLISYNVNTFDYEEQLSDPTLYRPKFITLDLE